MNRRAAFTLVELLVVAGIFAMLFGLVLTGARPNANSQVRQAAQQLASVLLATQSNAIGNPLGAAVILESGTAAGLADTMCVTVANADMLPFIEGSATGMPPPSSNLPATVWPITIDNSSLNADSADLASGYRIQFYEKGSPAAQPPSAWLAFANPEVRFRTTDGQTAQNTIWPAPVGGGAFDFRIARYPNKAESIYAFPKAAAIDLRWSGVGEDAATIWQRPSYASGFGGLASKGAVSVKFDAVGGIDALLQQVVGVIDPTSPVYLLVAARADVDENRSLSSDRSLWVVIHHQTGRVTISSNVAQTGTDAAALRAARAKARTQAAIGK